MSELLMLSGGIDSVAIAAWRRPDYCLTVDYGQRPAASEIGAAQEASQRLGLPHSILHVPINNLGCGVLAGRAPSPLSAHREFWPFRNQFLLTIGAMFAALNSLSSVLIGTVSTDCRHLDGSKEFVEHISKLTRLQEGQINIEAPAHHLTSVELVKASGIDRELLGWAHSCHLSNLACGSCPGCYKHAETLRALGWQ